METGRLAPIPLRNFIFSELFSCLGSCFEYRTMQFGPMIGYMIHGSERLVALVEQHAS